MQKEKSIKDWKRMYDELTNPDIRAEKQRKERIKKAKEQKKQDTGL